jgi:N6-adenosine-specific RNA methylase IME4
MAAHKRKTRAVWAQEISISWEKSVQSIIETGRTLQRAKDALKHGQFGKMIQSDLPFEQRTAQMLMRISQNPVISNAKNISLLPPNWTALYEMTNLSQPDLTSALKKGELGPETRLSDLKQYRTHLRLRNNEKGRASRANPTSRPRRAKTTDASAELEGLTGRKFGCFLVAPPWETMSTGDILSLPVESLAARNSHLHIWVPSSFLPEGLEAIECFGFTYKSSFVWTKPGRIAGDYWNENHELLLLGVRGSRAFRSSQRSWMELPRGKYGEKPARIRRLIEKVSPEPRLEMFATGKATPGWTSCLEAPPARIKKAS